MKINPLVGKKVQAVDLADDGKAIKFYVEGFDPIFAQTDGDCCSESWIEHIEQTENMLGTVLNVEDVDMPDLGDMPNRDVVTYYGCRIHTDKGIALIDFRNDSNGYYGGNLVWSGDWFYGGVYGQNIACVLNGKGAWMKVA